MAFRKNKEKKQKKKELELDELNDLNIEEKKHSKVVSVIIVILIILIWLGIFVFLIKLDVGGFGSSVLKPVLKDVPIVKEILPAGSDDEETDKDYPYKSLSDAIAYIKELELQIQKYQEGDTDNSDKIADLQAEVNRLKTFEENQQQFEEEKSKFYEEVVFGDNAIDTENYKEYYESIDEDNAAKIYKEVVEQQQNDEKYKKYAETYSNMKPKEAATIFLNMTSDLDTVVAILNNMSASSRGKVLGAMSSLDANFAAKVTQMLAP